MVLAVDVGGTFTDVVLVRDGSLLHAKSFTTPGHMEEGVKAAIGRLLEDAASLGYVFHGTTAVINALLERKGARTALLTTAGFRDVLELGRGSRLEPFDMLFAPQVPFIPRRWRREVNERMDAQGNVLTPVNKSEVIEAAQSLVHEGVESLAICFLNSYANPDHERQAAAWVRESLPDLSVTASSEMVREWREYERTSTAVMNAYVKPMMSNYLDGLESSLEGLEFEGRLQLLQSSGGSTAPTTAREQPLRLVESGPAAGITGAAALASKLDLRQVVTFDMGGTTAKAGIVIDFTPATVRPYYVGSKNGMPSLLPVVDISEIGAGGGSIAYRDEAGALKVGPKSAGAEPGPVCYGRGGTQPTISDAHVILGRINPSIFLGGEVQLDVAAAAEAFRIQLAEPLGMTVEQAAVGVLRIANNKMAMLLREVSLYRGHDPRELTMIASGGAGPLHAVDIARELSIPRVIIPPWPAHFGAFGMLHSDLRHEYSRSLVAELSEDAAETITSGFAELEALASIDASNDAIDSVQLHRTRYVELCYVGQENTLPVPLTDAVLANSDWKHLEARFHEMHGARYGFAAKVDRIRVMGIRLETRFLLPRPGVAQGYPESRMAAGLSRRAFIGGAFVDAAVVDRATLSPGSSLAGPAIIEESAATTVVGLRDTVVVDGEGNLIVSVSRDDS